MPSPAVPPRLFGDRSRFAAELDGAPDRPEGTGPPGDLRRVGLWAAGHWLTCDDDTVYVPQFRHSLGRTLAWLRSGPDLRPPFPGLSPAENFQRVLAADTPADAPSAADAADAPTDWPPAMPWGPTTDNLRTMLFRVGPGHLALAFQFWREDHHDPAERGVVVVAELPEAEYIGVLEDLLAALG